MSSISKSTLKLAFAVVGSAAVASGVTYLVAYKILEKKFDDRLAYEIQEAKVLYQNMYQTPTFVVEEPSLEDESLLERIRNASEVMDAPPRDLVGEALSAQRRYQGDEEEDVPDERPPLRTRNIFEDQGKKSVEASLLADRDPSGPYIITRQEFLDNEPDFEQRRFTFWEGDSMLVDDADEFNPVPDNDKVAGEDNLMHFGVGSDDEATLYVRNETLEPPLDLHITLSSGKYSHEVMGLDDDEPHLAHSQPRKFRSSDE